MGNRHFREDREDMLLNGDQDVSGCCLGRFFCCRFCVCCCWSRFTRYIIYFRWYVLCCYRIFFPSVKLYVPEQKQDDFKELFSESLTTHLKYRSVDCIKVNMDNVFEQGPLLLVCPLDSRIDDCIGHVLEGFDRRELLIVILVHLVTKKDSKIKTKVPQEYAHEYIKYIDMAFNVHDKLYNCDINNDALYKISEYVKIYKGNKSKRLPKEGI